MTQTKDAPLPPKKKVLVMCAGINTRTGFNVYPPRFAPVYLDFYPGQATEIDAEIAEHLVSLDPTKFSVVEATASEKKDDAAKGGAKK